jgi:uncharacterized protein (DUF1778 family)
MSKNITLKVSDTDYELLKKAADGEKRSLQNFIEYAALAYVTESFSVSDEEMNEIVSDSNLTKSLNKGLSDIKKGRYKIVR